MESCGVVASEFGLTGQSGALPTGLSDELRRFVETRDQGLARLEELYTRFTQNLLEERDKNSSDFNARLVSLNEETENKRKQLDEQFAAKVAEHAKRENDLADRLKKIDDRGAKHARRALRDSITTELNKRETSFTLTKGTNSLRSPIVAILLGAALLFTAGLVHNALIAGEVLSKPVNGFDWGLTYFTLKQLTYTAGLISVIWYGIRWNDRWFREHANEEFKAKTMQIDILRANWVVETLLEWEREEGREIPPELLTSLTHNLFRYPEESHEESGASSLASVLLGSASKARLKVGADNELEFSRAGAKKLSKELAK
jgi:hypothetical protein